MTDQQHPITPPPELVRHWSRFQGDTDPEALWFRIANEAAQWGWDQRESEIRAVADQELEACCKWLREAKNHGLGYEYGQELADRYRAARRPKPPSLKEQALTIIDDAHRGDLGDDEMAIIRRALEQLDD